MLVKLEKSDPKESRYRVIVFNYDLKLRFKFRRVLMPAYSKKIET